ncbi:MAG: type II toxin-antitoxin system RelE/ParE family toxin [bacterium]|nr:type II toxin-antitoxin system RelE/ParE family toxin [bacterium]
MGRVVLQPTARTDLVEHFAYIGQASGEEAARRFLRNAYATFDDLADRPRIGVSRRFRNAGFATVRMWKVKGFKNHLIFYRPRNDGVAIMRVVHGARNLEQLFR